MRNKKPIYRLLSVLAMLIFVLSILPVSVTNAAEDDSDSKNDGVVVSKTATLDNDGTYTIELSAYATGTTTSVPEKRGVPLDIVLVLDQSGSMNNNRYVEPLKTAVRSFVNTISENGKEYNVDHRIAMVGYASRYDSSSKWSNTGLFIEGSLYNYQKPGSSTQSSRLTAQDYKKALVSVNDQNGNVTNSITTAITKINGNGATYTNYGMEMANGVFENNPIENDSDRKRIVVVFTDGEPGRSGYDGNIASAAVKEGYTTKNSYGATVYTIGLYSSASNNVKNFMNYLSSNYPGAQSMFNTGTKNADKYYMTTSNSSELENIFTNISNDIQNPSTTVTLNAESVMRDVLADGFVFPTGYSKDASITIKTVAGSTTDGKNITWGEEISQPSDITSSISGNKVEITGFDYSQKYIAPSHNGEKLIVTIKGIEATDEAITDGIVNTNQETSGIYANSNSEIAAIKFPQPTTKLTSKNYVLDFGKKVNLAASEWLQTSVTSLNGTGMNQFNTPTSDLTKSYGKVNLNATTPSGLTYTPTKINWDGYDSFYAFGKSNDTSVKAASANTNGNLWSKISVIPATSVYYEDDFMLTENTAKDSTVSIVYSNDWQVEGTSQDEAQSSANERYGYDSSYEGDWQLSNGSAHYVKGAGEASYATFTFTGTGVDIYSKTDMSSGVIAVTLYKGQSTDDQAEVKTLYVDNLYKSGTLYQIPTATFENLPHGQYTVKIMVANGGTTGGRNTYYLDGIRVYNPIDVEKEDEVSQKAGAAYDEAEERVAVTTEVRDTLLTANSFNAATLNNGSVFIDELNGTSTDVSTYEELGPKNEVYLAKGNAVAFEIKATYSGKTMIGMKAPNGAEGSITVSDGNDTEGFAKNKTVAVKSATDMYYEIQPTVIDGHKYVVLENTGDNMVAITKLRLTNTALGRSVKLLSSQQLMNYVANFNAINVASDVETNIVEASKADKESASTSTVAATEKETVTTEAAKTESSETVTIKNAKATTSQEETNEEATQLWNSIKSSVATWMSSR